MLRNVKGLEGYTVDATTVGAIRSELGNVADVYFDDRRWDIRYLVVETGGWLNGRKVLISPASVHSVAWVDAVMHVNLSQQQVKDSPSISTDEPVSRHRAHGDLDQASPDPHLRSCNDVVGHEIATTDGTIGSVVDFVFDDRSWAIRHLVVDTRKWLLGKHVLLAPEEIDRIDWPERQVFVNATREAIETSPKYE